METKDTQETILPTKVPMRRWWRGPSFLFIALVVGMLALGLIKLGGSTVASAEVGPEGGTGETEVVACKAPANVIVRQVKPVGIDRSKCEKLPNIGEATCRTGEVGMRIGRNPNGGYRRVYCGGCERVIYPQDIQTTVEMNEGGAK